MFPYRLWLLQWQLLSESVRLSVAAQTTIATRLTGLALGDGSEIWRMCIEKPPALLRAQQRTATALGRGKGWDEALRAGMMPLRLKAESNAKRLTRR